MELVFEKVQSAGPDVSSLVNQLVAAEPAVYRVGSGTYNEVSQIRDALKAHRYVGRIKSTGEVIGERTLERGKNKGQVVQEIKHELLITVTAPAGEYEPQPAVEAVDATVPEATPEPEATEAEADAEDAPKGKRR